jgi:hypothetical protein
MPPGAQSRWQQPPSHPAVRINIALFAVPTDTGDDVAMRCPSRQPIVARAPIGAYVPALRPEPEIKSYQSRF